ncbi:MAG: hypothetical protein Q4G70_12650 [Pseudomonadota bacterium]|nr:hypothetical protein [Pseudomonadota bacterium]
MYLRLVGFDDARCPDGHATQPVAPRWACHAALLVLAGSSLQRPRVLPGMPITARSGAFNCRF